MSINPSFGTFWIVVYGDQMSSTGRKFPLNGFQPGNTLVKHLWVVGVLFTICCGRASAQSSYDFVAALTLRGGNSYDVGSANYSGMLATADQYGFTLTDFKPMPTAAYPTYIFTFTSVTTQTDTVVLTTSKNPTTNKVRAIIVASTQDKPTFVAWKAKADNDATWEHRVIQDNMWEYEYSHSPAFPRNFTLQLGVKYSPAIQFGVIPTVEETAVTPITYVLTWTVPAS